MSSRERFEAWVVGRKVVKKHGAKLNTASDGTYCDYRINDRWLAWQAAISAIEIELPVRSCDAAVSGMNYHKGWNDCLDWSRKNIEEDGLRVKS